MLVSSMKFQTMTALHMRLTVPRATFFISAIRRVARLRPSFQVPMELSEKISAF